jgi:hypothetical protein
MIHFTGSSQGSRPHLSDESTWRCPVEVASFDIRYNCILGRPFLLKFIVVIHTAYAILKMSGPKGVITIKDDQRDALAYENTILTHAG